MSADHTAPTRRSVLAASAAMAALGLTGRQALADVPTITGIMPGPFLPEPLKAPLSGMAGATLQNSPYISPADTLAKLLAPGGESRFDVVISLSDFVRAPLMGAKAGAEHILPLDMSLIPNAKSITPLFQKDITVRDGKTYMIPVVWGYDSVIFNSDKLSPQDPTTQSWKVLFDDRNAGKVAWRDDAQCMILSAALSQGIADPVSMSDSDLNEIGKFLAAKKKNVRTMWSQFGEAVSLMASGEVYAMYGWIPMRAALQKQGLKVTNNWPTDGLLVWSQSGFIPKGSHDVAAAHRIINAMLSPEYGASLMKETNYPTTNSTVPSAFSAEDQHRFGLDVASTGQKTYPMKMPATMDRWLEVWNTVKAG